MTPQTMYAIVNEADIDFDEDFCPTLADAIGYAEFEEEVNSWKIETEEI